MPRCLDLGDEPLALGDDDSLRTRDDDDARGIRLHRLFERVQRARRADQLLAERAGRDQLAVAEEDAHELAYPLAGGLRQIDEPEEMAGRRGVDDDRGLRVVRDQIGQRVMANSSSAPGGAISTSFFIASAS